jgi:hypothetical protein
MPFTPFLNNNDDDCYTILITFVFFLIYMAVIIFINLNIIFNEYNKLETAYKSIKFKYERLLVDFDEYKQEQDIDEITNDENKYIDNNNQNIKKNQ